MELPEFMNGLFPDEGINLVIAKKFFKGEADVFSLVLEYIEKRGISMRFEGNTELPCADIINEINNYINDITKAATVDTETLDGMKNAAKWFETYFKDETAIELNELRYIYNAFEERFQVLWMNCLD